MEFSGSPIFLTSSPQCSEACTHSDSSCAFQVGYSINPHMKIGAVDPILAAVQHSRFILALRTAGAEVLELPFLHGEFDSVFIKDSALVINRDGESLAMLTKPSTLERAAEPFQRRAGLVAQGFEVEFAASQMIEGGDIIVVPAKRKIFLGYGQRSSQLAASELKEFTGFEVVTLELVDPYFFHLDTALNFVELNGHQIAFAYKQAFSAQSWVKLITNPHVSVVIEVDREEALKFGLNWIEVKGTVVLGSRPLGVIEKLKALGKNIVVAPLDQFQLAGGSAACLATRVHEVTIPNHDEIVPVLQRWSEPGLVPN